MQIVFAIILYHNFRIVFVEFGTFDPDTFVIVNYSFFIWPRNVIVDVADMNHSYPHTFC